MMESFNLNTKILVYSVEECNENIKNLIKKAQEATQNAYAHYSGFSVGAAILLSNGEIIQGSNQENAAYPSGLCAERTAMFYANSAYPNQNIEAIAIAAYHNGQFTEQPCCPCGACRQALLETENRHKKPMRIIMCGRDKIHEVGSVKELLPLSFGSESLGK